jgi:nucleoside-diphosphate-sugar epimerase
MTLSYQNASIDVSSIPLSRLFGAIAQKGEAVKFAVQNGHAFVAFDEHATLSAPLALAESINAITKNKTKPGVKLVPRRDWDHITRRVCNNHKAKNELGWTAKTDLKTGLEKTWSWFQKAVPG